MVWQEESDPGATPHKQSRTSFGVAASNTMKDNVSTESPPTIHGIKVRDLVLAMLLLQTTAVVLLMRYSATRVVPGVPGYSRRGLFFAELLKLPFCVCMAKGAPWAASRR